MSSNIKVNRICENCGNTFVALTTVTRFCSRSCNNRFLKNKIKELKIIKSNTQVAEIVNKPLRDLKNKDYLSLDDTCQLLGVSRMTLHRQIKAGRIKAIKIGRRVIISKAHIQDLFA